MSNHTQKKLLSKPAKPYSAFPLFAHAANMQVRKIMEIMYYLGSWSDPGDAVEVFSCRPIFCTSMGLNPSLKAGELARSR